MSKQKRADSTAITVTTKENAIKKTFGKRFAKPLDFDFFKHAVYPYGLKEDLIVRLELNSSEKVLWCSVDTATTYKLSGISLEYDAIIHELYAKTIGQLYPGTMLIPYTKVTSIHYQSLWKKTLLGRLNLTTCLFIYYKVYCYYFLINTITLPTKMKNFTTLESRTF